MGAEPSKDVNAPTNNPADATAAKALSPTTTDLDIGPPLSPVSPGLSNRRRGSFSYQDDEQSSPPICSALYPRPTVDPDILKVINGTNKDQILDLLQKLSANNQKKT